MLGCNILAFFLSHKKFGGITFIIFDIVNILMFKVFKDVLRAFVQILVEKFLAKKN